MAGRKKASAAKETEQPTKIPVADFVSKVNALETVESRQDYIKTIIVDRYIEYEAKDGYVQNIILASSYARDKDGNRTNTIKISSNQRQFNFTITLLQLYTNLDLSAGDTLDGYNMLEKYGLTDEIISFIPHNEVKIFTKMLDNAVADFEVNNLSTRAYVESLVEQLTKVTDGLGEGMKSLVPSLQKILDNITEEDTGKIVELITRAFQIGTSK